MFKINDVIVVISTGLVDKDNGISIGDFGIIHTISEYPYVYIFRLKKKIIINQKQIKRINYIDTSTGLLKEVLADLEGIMPEFEPSGDKQHPAWETISRIKNYLEGK